MNTDKLSSSSSNIPPNMRRGLSRKKRPTDTPNTHFRWVWLLILLVPVLFAACVWGEKAKTPAAPNTQKETRAPQPAATSTPGVGAAQGGSPEQNAVKSSSRLETNWFFEDIDLRPKVGIYASLIRGDDGTLYAAYMDDTRDDLKFATKTDSTWKTKTIVPTSPGQDGLYPALAFDPKGALHLTYYSYSSQQIRYGSMNADGDWRYENVGGKVSAGSTSLVISADDVPQTAFFDEKSNQLRYAVKQNNDWKVSTIATVSKDGVVYPIALDHENQLHAAYMGESGGLYYASLQGKNWKAESVDDQPGAGAYPSLAFDAAGQPHISYYDQSTQDLKYAYWNGANWQTATIDETGDVGKFSSLAVDQNGFVHVSYYDETNTWLKYAYGQRDQWKIFTVDNNGKVGKYTSLILDKNNNPGISYFDEEAKGLMYAHADIYNTNPASLSRLFAIYRSGQTFLSWYEDPSVSGEIYRVYRSNQPIDKNNVSQAALLAEVGEDSAHLWSNYYTTLENKGWHLRLSESFIIEKNAPHLRRGMGALVWTLAPEDFGGNANGTGYYAVTILDKGSASEQFYSEYMTGPVEEAVDEPQPVEVTKSPGIITQADPGGHYYLQYMDLRHWNATFHAPNAINEYYGFDPKDPTVQHALAYVYDYAIFEPTPKLCNGSVPKELPVLIFLHGARGNRYGTPDKYPYPYCAYGVYPIDQSESWYFGFAQKHDFRTNDPFSPDDVIENFTEQRILRMIYDLIRNPPGAKVDTQRIYLFGHSMGGTGSLAFAQRYPNVFAAIYSGQPVTQFYATQGYKESWPENLAKKWGPQDMNLPILISAPNHWADHLQKYNGTGVFEWENLRAAFDPNDRLDRIRDDMVPFGIDHGTIDDSVQFPTQGQPLYPLLNNSTQPWAGAVTESTHQWSNFAWALPNFANVKDVPFWNFRVIRDETVPGLRMLSGNLTEAPTEPTTYNQTILWSSSWNAWDGKPVDSPTEWQMSFCTVKPGEQKCGGDSAQVDITPRRLQQFVTTPGQTYRWENLQLDGKEIQSGTVTADDRGLITIPQVQIHPEGSRLRIYAQ